MPSSQRLVHLVRHGEVWNPHHVVYSALPGYGLSGTGHRQARAAAARLADRPLGRVVSSPLQRAIETAIPIAARHGLRVSLDSGLIEWRLSTAWVGKVWEELPTQLPGQLEAYLEDPANLSFAEETLADLGTRMAEAVQRSAAATKTGDLVVVSHQDPIESGRRRLTGRDFADFNATKPGHATVISLDPTSRPWREVGAWTPG